MSSSTPTLLRADDRAIAVIGMSGRFPGAPTVAALWDLLASGDDAVTGAPSDRPWLREPHDPRPGTQGRVLPDRGGFLPGLDLFDAAFFDMSPREACRTDPQTRLLLEVACEALEDAGIPVGRLSRSRTGVFIGNTAGDYWLRQVADLDGLDFYLTLGAQVRAAFSGRLAYAFDLHGPTVTVDTACSSSLAAVHLACQSLRAGECGAALAGGANLILTPYEYVTYGRPARCRPGGGARSPTAPPTVSSAARQSVWCCSSRWPRRWPQATEYVPSLWAAPSAMTGSPVAAWPRPPSTGRFSS